MGLVKEKSCGCIIIRDNEEVLLVCEKRRNNFWGFPKGHIEHDETEAETATREVLEEVGLKVEIDESKRYEMKYIVEDRIDKTAVFFVAKPITEEIKKQECEIADVKWCKFYEAMELLTYDNSKELLRKVIDDISF